MRPTVNLFVVCLVAIALLSSCVSKKKFTELEQERDRIAKSLEESQRKAQELEASLGDLQTRYDNEVGSLTQQVTDIRNQLATAQQEATNAKQMADKAQTTLNKLDQELDQAFNAYETSGLMLEEVNDHIYVKTSSPINFSTGSFRLGREDRAVIDSIAAILKNNPNLEITVEGHADNQAVNPGSSLQDNWNLSAQRALQVTRALVAAGVSPAQLSAAGKGEFLPAMADADQNSSDARSANRRVVLKIAPKLGGLYNVSKEIDNK